MQWNRIVAVVGGLALLASLSEAETIAVAPVRNNTLYERDPAVISNGAGQHTFIGVTGQPKITRTLLAFDVAGSVPTGATITAATLTLNVSNPLENPDAIATLHRVLVDWGEGTSNAGTGPQPEEGAGAPATEGDATWVHTFFDTNLWTKQGGDFVAPPSASQVVGGNGIYTWGSSPGMVADAQSWLDNPDSDFGWIVLGDESRVRTAKRLDSRHNNTASVRPRLEITYELAVATATDTAAPTSTSTPQETATPTATSTPSPQSTATRTTGNTPVPGGCVGDCDSNGMVTINELITGVNVGLGTLDLDTCPVFDANGDGMVTINEIIQGVNNGQNNCPS